jgi:hypothetical protein
MNNRFLEIPAQYFSSLFEYEVNDNSKSMIAKRMLLTKDIPNPALEYSSPFIISASVKYFKIALWSSGELLPR